MLNTNKHISAKRTFIFSNLRFLSELGLRLYHIPSVYIAIAMDNIGRAIIHTDIATELNHADETMDAPSPYDINLVQINKLTRLTIRGRDNKTLSFNLRM